MRRLKTACAVIVTASHNPKIYNGYKAYDNQGGQVVAPWDAEVEAGMAAEPLVPVPRRCGRPHPAHPAELEEAFLAMSQSFLARPKAFLPTPVLYTPSTEPASPSRRSSSAAPGCPLEVCKPRRCPMAPSPRRPGPNPEELATFGDDPGGCGTQGISVILASDPDADRLGVLVKREGRWLQMSGNDMAALTLDYWPEGA